MLMRRLRGVLASIVGGALTGAVGGALLGALMQALAQPGEITVIPALPGGALTVFGLWAAAVGAVSGGVFATLLMIAERGRGIQDLRGYRVAGWSALATAACMRLGGASPTLIGMGAAFAAGIGAAAVWLAKRGAAAASNEADAAAISSEV
jgi:hypothetical protein